MTVKCRVENKIPDNWNNLFTKNRENIWKMNLQHSNKPRWAQSGKPSASPKIKLFLLLLLLPSQPLVLLLLMIFQSLKLLDILLYSSTMMSVRSFIG